MKISFEDALKRLDEISIKLESSNVSLSDSLKLYEEAVELGEFCKNELNVEDGKIKILRDKLQGLVEDNFEE